MSFKDISYLELWAGPCVRWSGTINAILVEGIMGDLHVKLNFNQWNRRCRLKKKFTDG